MSNLLNTHTLPPPSFLLTVKITIHSSLKPQFLSYMRPAFDAVVAERECVYFVLGSRGREMGEAVGGKRWVRARAGDGNGSKGLKREGGDWERDGGRGEGGGIGKEGGEGGKEGEEGLEDAVEVWWSEGWRIEESEEVVGGDEDRSRNREAKIKGWKEGLTWLMAVQVKKEYYKPYLDATEGMFLVPRQIEIYAPEEGFMVFKGAQ